MLAFHYVVQSVLLTASLPNSISASSVLPLSSSNSSHVNSVLTADTKICIRDERFSITTSFNGPNIPVVGSMINILETLELLALQDFSGVMPPQSWSLSDYADVGITISPAADEMIIQRRFAVWGLCMAAEKLVNSMQFESATFSLFYDANIVGTIKVAFRDRRPGTTGTVVGTEANSTQPLFQQPSLNFLNDTARIDEISENISAIQAADDEGLKVQAAFVGPIIASYDVFLLLAGVITYAAEMGTHGQVDNFVLYRTSPDLAISVMNSQPPRTTPPIFEAQWLIKAMAMLPYFMLRKGAFRETLFVLGVDGVGVANGLLGTIDSQGPPQSMSSLSVS